MSGIRSQQNQGAGPTGPAPFNFISSGEEFEPSAKDRPGSTILQDSKIGLFASRASRRPEGSSPGMDETIPPWEPDSEHPDHAGFSLNPHRFGCL